MLEKSQARDATSTGGLALRVRPQVALGGRLLEMESLVQVFELLGPRDAALATSLCSSVAGSAHAEAYWRKACAEREAVVARFQDEEVDLGDASAAALGATWRYRFARLHGNDCAREHRWWRLEVALAEHGLELREDSVLCRQYVDEGGSSVEGGMTRVVDTMIEMDFYFRGTSYPDMHQAVVEELSERAWTDAQAAVEAGEDEELHPADYVEYIGRLDVSELAKERALRAYLEARLLAAGSASAGAGPRSASLLEGAPVSLHGRLRDLLAGAVQGQDGEWRVFGTRRLGNDEASSERRARLRARAQADRRQVEASLDPHIEAMQRLARAGARGAALQFPPCLGAGERARLHAVAEEMGLEHESVGVGSQRSLVVSRTWD